MSAAAKKLPLAEAQRLAAGLIKQLAPACLRIEVAGSIRREKPEIGDIELVAIPKRTEDLFGGEANSLLDDTLAKLCVQRHLKQIKGGDKFKQFEIPDQDYREHGVGTFICKLDLFLATPETWGCIYLIRTGPAEFSKRLVTDKRHGGYCPAHLRFTDGRLQSKEYFGPIETPEEKDVFAALGMNYIEPKDRK